MAGSSSGRYIGQPLRRREDRPLLVGRTSYVDDITLPGTVHLAFVRSPHAHARIRSLDASAAAAAPGVLRVLTAADTIHLPRAPVNRVVADLQDLRVPPYPLLAGERVTAVGQPVAAIVATTRAAACDAAELVRVAYEPLPAVVEPQAALAPGAPLVHPELGTNVAYRMRRGQGDVAAAFARAAHVVALDVMHPRVHAVPLEPRGVLAAYDVSSETLTVWDSTQSVFRVRSSLAAVLGIAEPRIRVVAPDVGGSFGAKGSVYREEFVVALAARLVGRPVKWIATRSEDFLGLPHGRGMQAHAELALDAAGRFLALRERYVLDVGADLVLNSIWPVLRVATLAPGLYAIPAAEVEAVGVFTNAPPTAPYRGAGRPEAALTLERLIDTAAHALGLDPVELRRRNLVGHDALPYATATGLVYDSGDYGRALELAAEALDYAGQRRRQLAARERGALVGIGVATFVEPGGVGWESGSVFVDLSGQVIAHTGATPHGQGHLTTYAQIVADRLGVPIERVTVRANDTAVVPIGSGTGASRSLTTAGNALALAADEVLAKARRVAAQLLEAAPEDVRVAEDSFSVAGLPERSVSWPTVAQAAYLRPPPGERPGLDATTVYQGPDEVYGYGCYGAIVQIDRDTGAVTVERLVAVDDCGVIVNPLLVEGQVLGGVVQGLGQALCEELRFDASGQLLTGTLLDYAVPVASDVPPVALRHIETPSPRNPLGVKGVGEAGAIGALAAVANAVVDALRPLGVAHLDVPLMAEKVWRALRGRG